MLARWPQVSTSPPCLLPSAGDYSSFFSWWSWWSRGKEPRGKEVRAARSLDRAGLGRHSVTSTHSAGQSKSKGHRQQGEEKSIPPREAAKSSHRGVCRDDLRPPAIRPWKSGVDGPGLLNMVCFLRKKKVQGLKEAFENHSMIANSSENTLNTGVRSISFSPEEKSSWQEQQGS